MTVQEWKKEQRRKQERIARLSHRAQVWEQRNRGYPVYYRQGRPVVRRQQRSAFIEAMYMVLFVLVLTLLYAASPK